MPRNDPRQRAGGITEPGLLAEQAEARRFRILALIAVIAVLLALASYSALVWRKAVKATPAVLERADRLANRGLSFAQLPPAWREILIAVEDPGFAEHHGVDLRTAGTGFNTITRSLVRWHYARPFKGGMTSIEQLIAARVLDARMSKQAQLDLYLNSAEFGRHDGKALRGFRQASFAWFGRPLRALTENEFTALVATLVTPEAFNPVSQPQANAERVQRIQRYLAGACRARGPTDVYYRDCTG